MPSEEKHLDQEIPRETNHFAVIALLVLCLASQDAPDSNDYREHTMEIEFLRADWISTALPLSNHQGTNYSLSRRTAHGHIHH